MNKEKYQMCIPVERYTKADPTEILMFVYITANISLNDVYVGTILQV
jgi:hypothetical protein